MTTTGKLSENVLAQTAAIGDAVSRLEAAVLKLLVVLDGDDRVIGTVSDGDVRRGLLRGLSLASPVLEVINASPVLLGPGGDRPAVLAEMDARMVKILPLVDSRGTLVGLEELDPRPSGRDHPNLVVVMAGGKGTRLAPLTETCPKPMVKIGEKPILETIVDQLRAQGFRRICLSVNYLAEAVRDYFGDGARWGVEISYIHETEPRGTAGALSLIREEPDAPVLVVNGDLLTRLDFSRLISFHEEQRAEATVCLREYEFQIPFGAVELDGVDIVRIREKPVYRCFVSAGIYCLSPQVLREVPLEGRHDMPELLNCLAEQGRPIRPFPIHEYWLDIGCVQDLNLAQSDFRRLFIDPQ